MVPGGTPLCPQVLHRVPSENIVPRGTTLCPKVPHSAPRYHVVPEGTSLHSKVAFCPPRYHIVPHCTTRKEHIGSKATTVSHLNSIVPRGTTTLCARVPHCAPRYQIVPCGTAMCLKNSLCPIEPHCAPRYPIVPQGTRLFPMVTHCAPQATQCDQSYSSVPHCTTLCRKKQLAQRVTTLCPDVPHCARKHHIVIQGNTVCLLGTTP
jgi:hypothetical protein